MSKPRRNVLHTVPLTLACAACLASGCSNPSAPTAPVNPYSGRWSHAYFDKTSIDFGPFTVADNSTGTFMTGPVRVQPGITYAVAGQINAAGGAVSGALVETVAADPWDGPDYYDFYGSCTTTVDCSIPIAFTAGQLVQTYTLELQR